MSGEALALAGGRYELESVLGQGAMATVYRAYDATLGVYRAVKVLRKAQATPTGRQRFFNDARAMARIDHPNVVSVHDVGEEQGLLYMVLQLEEGGSLRDRVVDGGALPLAEAVAVAEQVLGALGAAHRLGIVHRDVKPANLLISSAGTVRLGDFGIAQLADADLTRTGARMGTPAFMAPEQAAGSAVGPGTDLFALAATVVYLLTGSPPPKTGELQGIPASIAPILLRAMAPRLEDRYPSAAEMAAALQPVVRGHAEPLRPTTSSTTSRRTTASRRVRRFALLELLGRGGFGSVYRCRLDDRHGYQREVALKVIRADRVRASDLQRFRDEARLGGLLDDRAVVSAEAPTQLGAHWAVVMQLARGASVARLLNAGPLPPAVALAIVGEVARALNAVWEAPGLDGRPLRVVHRDLKPNNLHLTPAGEVKILDWGLAQAVFTQREAQTVDHVGGTPGYIPPERLSGREGPEGDVFSLGVVLHELVAGVRPPEGASAEGLARAALALAERMRAADPSARPSALEVHALCSKLRAGSSEPTLAGWAAVHAQPGRGLEPDALVGTVLAESTLTSDPDGLGIGFIGRSGELEALAAHIREGHRLVTLLGPAGVGKTTLAREFMVQERGAWEGGIWFCDLAAATDVSSVLAEVARGLDVALTEGDGAAQLGWALAGRGPALVVLDNAETVLASVVSVLRDWLVRAEQCCFLLTSRVRVDLPEEWVLAVDPVAIGEAMQLFEARASQARPGFSLTTEDREVVRTLVQRLDCLPLAVELAAARMRVLQPAEVLARLDRRFDLLRRTSSQVRSSGLRVALDISWELLEPWEQQALAQCSVFRRGFTLAAAEAVIDVSDGPGAPWVLDLVEALLAQSMVQFDAKKRRFRLLESVREYASEHLGHRGSVEARHAAHYAAMGADRAVFELAPNQGGEPEIDNLLAAARGAAPVDDRARCALAALRAIQHSGPFVGALEWVEQLLGQDLPDGLRARLLREQGVMLRISGRQDASVAVLERAQAVFVALGERPWLGVVLQDQADSHRAAGRLQPAHALLAAAREVHRETGAGHLEARALATDAGIHHVWGKQAESLGLFEAALAMQRDLGDIRGEGATLTNFGLLQVSMGRNDLGRATQERALAIHRRVGHRRFEGISLANLGLIEPDGSVALDLFAQALAIQRGLGDRRLEVTVLGYCAERKRGLGELESSRELFELAIATGRELGMRQAVGTALDSLASLHMERGEADVARALLEEAADLHGELGHRSAEGVVLSKLGVLALLQGDVQGARELLDRSLALNRASGNRSHEAYDLERLAQILALEGDLPAAAAAAREALAIAESTSNRNLRGVCLGAVAELDDAADSQALFEQADALLRPYGLIIDLGLLHLRRGRSALRRGDPAIARAALAELKAVAAGRKASPGSVLDKAVRELEALLLG